MKKVLILSLAVLSLSTVFANPKKKKKAAATTEAAAPAATPAAKTEEQDPTAKAEAKVVPLTFKEMSYSFGKVKQGVPVTHEFSFKNSSGGPVVIESATAQCGCTTPEYNKAPIAKGASDKIKVTYNAASVGSFTKQVTVRVAKNTDPIILTINGEVLANAAPAPSAEEKKD